MLGNTEILGSPASNSVIHIYALLPTPAQAILDAGHGGVEGHSLGNSAVSAERRPAC